MFGGKSVSGVLNDTWEWDGTTWAPRAVASPPAGRFAAVSFFDPLAQRVVMHGGATSSTTYDDSWEWNGSSWRAVPTPGGAPPLRAFSTGALDTKRNVFVLFGGLDVNGVVLSDTWEFSLATRTWAKRSPATTPPGRQFSAMAFDSDREKMVMTGGLNLGSATQVLDDTWEWDGIDWVNPGYTGATFLETHTMAYDKKRSRMVMFVPYASFTTGIENATGELEGNTWVMKLSGGIATTNQLPMSVYDPVSERVVMYSPDAFGSALWEWSGSAWTRRGPGAGPGGRGFPCMASDTDRKRFIYFGGTIGAGLNDIWEFDGGGWANKTPAGLKPEPRYQCAMAYDSLRKQAVLFGGDVTGVGQVNDTWLWNGSTWTKKVTATLPPGTAGGVMEFDTARGKTVLLTTNPSETWEFDGTDWSKKATATSIPMRFYAASAFDPVRGKMMVFGGGDSPTSVLNDTWEYDGVDWTKRLPATSPSIRGFSRAVWDSSRGKILMYGGTSGSGAGGLSSDFKNEVWEWDGTNWRQLDAEKPPVVAALGIGLGFDGKNVVLAGTSTEGSALLLTQKTDVCATTADCLSGSYCVDGVCCQSTACNACETCNGATPGICTPIVNKEDADSCAGGKSCSDKAVCLEAIGAECTDGTTCASGNCVDGVCCDSACDGTCVACRDSLKQENSRNGLCGPAKTGVTEAACAPSEASTCGQDGTCDGRGSCAKYAKGTVCGTDFTCTTQSIASGRICDGLGVCSSDASPIDCSGFQCVAGSGCKVSCLPTSSTTDCASGFRCSSGQCKPAATSACADGSREYVDDVNTKSCGNYVCRERCLTSCGTVDDCAAGSVCDFESRCVPVPTIDTEGALGLFGCSQSPGRSANGFAFAALGGIGLLLARGVGRRRRD